MKIVVTGGAGFIGSSICLHLKSVYPEYQIIAFDNLKRRGSELNLADLKKAGVSFIHGDIRNLEDLDAIHGFDVMIEASAEPSVLAGLDSNPNYVIQNNLSGSINCFNACLKHKAKIIFLSTSRVYPIHSIENARYIEEISRFSLCPDQSEAGISAAGISEALRLDGPRSFYGATKLSSEYLLQEYAAFYDLQTAITRFSVVAGPRQMGKSDQGVATLWMASHFFKRDLKYIGNGGSGKQVRDFLHINDLVALIDKQVHTTEKFTGKIYNAGGGLENSLSLLEMTELCQEITGNTLSMEKVPDARMADVRIYISDNSKINNEIGWKPMHTARETFEDIYLWIKNNEQMLKPLFA
jgi:CDP-paratose 2-epimerase